MTIDPLVLCVVAVGFFAGGLCKGIIGFALPLVALAVLATVLDPLTAITIMVVPIVATNIWQVFGKGIEPLREPVARFWPMFAVLMVTLWLTARVAPSVPVNVVMGLIGTVMIIFVVTTAASPRFRLPERFELPVSLVAGFTSGLLGGAIAIWGPPVNLFYLALNLTKDQWMRSVGLLYMLGGVALLTGYLENGMLYRDTLVMSALACIPAFAGMWIGLKLQERIAQEQFRKIVLTMLFVVGVNFIRRALF